MATPEEIWEASEGASPADKFKASLVETFNEADAFLANCTPEEIAEAERELDEDPTS